MAKIRKVEEPGELLAFLFSAWPGEKRKQVRTWLKFQCVTVNGRAMSQFNHPLRPGDVVAIQEDGFAAPRTKLPLGLKVLFEDSAVIVIDKPEGLLSIASEAEPERTAYFQLTDYLRRGNAKSRERVWIVHRLDRETSGLMVFAKTPQAKEILQAGWDRAEKRYEAVVEGRLPKNAGVLESDLDERNPHKVFSTPPSAETRHAVTHYKVLAETPKRSLVSLRLETGRRHQIRVQLADAGCPVVGDKKYESRTDPAERLGLHACGLEFPHPVTGQRMKFTSPLPKELAKLVREESGHAPREPREPQEPRKPRKRR
jgi:23S rRNA pseudouridine1911/1915/1917 synthase